MNKGTRKNDVKLKRGCGDGRERQGRVYEYQKDR
jgi:hypothetical protein